MAENFWYKYIG